MMLSIAALDCINFDYKRQEKVRSRNLKTKLLSHNHYSNAAAQNHFSLSVLPGNGTTEDEEKLTRKVKPKPRSSAKAAAGKTSKYFQSPAKEEDTDSEVDFDMMTSPPRPRTVKAKKTEKKEEEEDSEDDFDMVTSPPRPLTVNAKKPEKKEEEEEDNDDDSEEDEDDWEEVEGK